MVIGKTLKMSGDGGKKGKGKDTNKKAEIDEALAFIAPTQVRPRAKITPQEAERRALLAKAYSRFRMQV